MIGETINQEKVIFTLFKHVSSFRGYVLNDYNDRKWI